MHILDVLADNSLGSLRSRLRREDHGPGWARWASEGGRKTKDRDGFAALTTGALTSNLLSQDSIQTTRHYRTIELD